MPVVWAGLPGVVKVGVRLPHHPIMTDKCYMVTITGYDMCCHCGVYRTYERALNRWHEVRIERLNEYIEDDKNDPAKLLGGWEDEIYVYSAETPEEHLRRRGDRGCIDVVRIEEYELRE